MKLFKILLLFIILTLALFSNVYATESEQDLSTSLQSLSSLLNNTTVNDADNTTDNAEISVDTTTSNAPASSQVVTTSNSSENSGLSVSDIINIILIAVGLVLIFLAVAILLRSK